MVKNYADILGSAQLSGLSHHMHCIWKILQLCCECEAVAWSGNLGIDWHTHRWDSLSTMSGRPHEVNEHPDECEQIPLLQHAFHSKAIINLELSCVCVRACV